jgi:tRNA G10  N-methylase Trm11
MGSTPFQSICILGRQPALGLAELESLFGADTIMPTGSNAASLRLHASDIDFTRLGGSTRLGHIMTTLPTTDWRTIEKSLPELITELSLTLPDGKIQLGISAFGLFITPARLNAAALTLKKVLRNRTGRSVRITPNPDIELNTAQVIHNHLTGPTGIELLLIADGNGQTVLARTMRVQDITSYTVRDRSRPKRDARVGMLPPKLAQIIINLASSDMVPSYETIVLDPFCGTGVVLMEATLMGFGVYGSDIDSRMIEYTDKNLEWLLEQPEYRHDLSIKRHDAAQLHFKLDKGDATSYKWTTTPNIVAGETYLGRPFTTNPSPELLAQTVTEVNLIIKKFLQNIAPQLPAGTQLCLAVPAWHTRYGFKHLPLIDQISDLGYNQTRFEHVRDEQLLYYREDQIVARQLLVLTRK